MTSSTPPTPSRPASVPEPSAVRALTRKPERARTERAALDELLRAEVWGVFATVLDGHPWVVPMLYGYDGDAILLHGSTGAGLLRHVASGAPVAFTVTRLDALVVGHTTFSSSANYRSCVVRGTATALDGDERRAALDRVSESLIPGRTGEVRAMTAKEIAATTMLRLPVRDGMWICKRRDGQAGEPDEPTDAWRGVVPLERRWGEPVAADGCAAPVPPSVAALAGLG